MTITITERKNSGLSFFYSESNIELGVIRTPKELKLEEIINGTRSPRVKSEVSLNVPIEERVLTQYKPSVLKNNEILFPTFFYIVRGVVEEYKQREDIEIKKINEEELKELGKNKTLYRIKSNLDFGYNGKANKIRYKEFLLGLPFFVRLYLPNTTFRGILKKIKGEIPKTQYNILINS